MNKQYLVASLIAAFILGMSFNTKEYSIEESAFSEKEDKRLLLSDNPFDTMMAVIMHKRCMNCHPSGDQPKQGEDSHLHYFDVQRGEDGHGLAGYTCGSCHQDSNNDFSGVPGAPHWHLAPKSMAWEGLSKNEIARSILDTEKNGGRSVEDIVKHLTEDALVLWAFEPGVDAEGTPREKPPVSKDAFIEAVKAWAADGAKIPNQ